MHQRQSGGADAIGVRADVTDPADLRAAAATAVARFGRLDTWVQTAAVMVYATFEDTPIEEFRRVLDVNLMGQVHGAAAALPHLRANGGGALIAVSSIEAEVSLPYQSAYAASKHGMAGLLRSLRMEMENEGVPIAITQVMPTSTDTPLFRKARTRLGVAPRSTPPVYDPMRVARAIVRAAEHPTGDRVVGLAGWVLARCHALLPGLTRRILRTYAARAQRSDVPKSADAPTNLWNHLDGADRIRGGAPQRAGDPGRVARVTPVRARARRPRSEGGGGGRYWIRTSDPTDVNRVL